MTDPTQQREPTQEELQAYLQQLRSADVSEILVQAYTVLGTGAEVKLGRPDARVVIDALAAMVKAVAGRVDRQLHQQMTAGVGQLQVAQVEAERQVGSQAAAGGEQPAGDSTGGEPKASPPGGEAPDGPSTQQRMTDRLWIPGRDPSPPGQV